MKKTILKRIGLTLGSIGTVSAAVVPMISCQGALNIWKGNIISISYSDNGLMKQPLIDISSLYTIKDKQIIRNAKTDDEWIIAINTLALKAKNDIESFFNFLKEKKLIESAYSNKSLLSKGGDLSFFGSPTFTIGKNKLFFNHGGIYYRINSEGEETNIGSDSWNSNFTTSRLPYNFEQKGEDVAKDWHLLMTSLVSPLNSSLDLKIKEVLDA